MFRLNPQTRREEYLMESLALVYEAIKQNQSTDEFTQARVKHLALRAAKYARAAVELDSGPRAA